MSSTSGRRRRIAAVTCLLALALTVPVAATAESSSGTFVGADGLSYASADVVLRGQDGELFYGPELDLACGLGDRISRPLKALARLTRIIESSGRTVVFSIAPGKTATMADLVGALPHGACDHLGLEAQDRLLDRFADPAYLPLRRDLSRTDHQMYWKTDLHWTTAGGAEYARAVASRLDPRLGRRQRYVYSTETRVGLLNQYAGTPEPETLELATPAGPVKVRNARRSDAWSGYPEFTFSNSWVSKPAGMTWPGQTLLLGDSFMWYALENLRPIFRHGEFLWFVYSSDTKVVRAITKADTVVIEIYQLVLPGTPLVRPGFRHQVKKALARAGR
jgi:hypothetical protein